MALQTTMKFSSQIFKLKNSKRNLKRLIPNEPSDISLSLRKIIEDFVKNF